MFVGYVLHDLLGDPVAKFYHFKALSQHFLSQKVHCEQLTQVVYQWQNHHFTQRYEKRMVKKRDEG